MLRAFHSLAAWCANIRGGIAVSFALSLPAVLAVVGLASDYAMMTKTRQDLQHAADAAAIAGAREIPLAMSNVKQVASAVRSYAAYQLTHDSAASDAKMAAQNFSVGVEVVDDFSAVNVTITEAWTPFFLHFIDAAVTPLTVTSQARFVGRNNVCVLGLEPRITAIFLGDGAKLTGNNCGVFSNSTDSAGLRIESSAVMSAQIVCSSGGASISGSASVSPAAITDCPATADPLLNRAAPSVGACDKYSLMLNNATVALDPGVYCGGLSIRGKSKVTLNPGVYIIKDGGLNVSGSSSFSGEGVGFYITGKANSTQFTAMTHISLEAPKDGPMAGLLFFEDRNLAVKLTHRITSDDARKLLGTIYFPVSSLVVDAKTPVADQSAYTAIVVRSLELNFGPNLVLNSNYSLTDVPVPAGIAGSSQVVLSN